MMAVKFSMPNMPKLEILKVPPEYSSGTNVPDLARSTRSWAGLGGDLAEGLFLRILDNGTIRPLSPATAMPILILW